LSRYNDIDMPFAKTDAQPVYLEHAGVAQAPSERPDHLGACRSRANRASGSFTP